MIDSRVIDPKTGTLPVPTNVDATTLAAPAHNLSYPPPQGFAQLEELTQSDEISVCADCVSVLCAVLPCCDDRVDDTDNRADEGGGELLCSAAMSTGETG